MGGRLLLERASRSLVPMEVAEISPPEAAIGFGNASGTELQRCGFG
jgi:hypothetical protein